MAVVKHIAPASALRIGLAAYGVLGTFIGSRSGTSVEWVPRSKVGNRRLRRALYMPALVAVRHDPFAPSVPAG